MLIACYLFCRACRTRFVFPRCYVPRHLGFWLIDYAPRVRRVSQGLQRTPVTEEALSFKGAFKRCQENWNAPYVYSAEHSRSVSSARFVDHSQNGNVLNFTEEKLLDGKQEIMIWKSQTHSTVRCCQKKIEHDDLCRKNSKLKKKDRKMSFTSLTKLHVGKLESNRETIVFPDQF